MKNIFRLFGNVQLRYLFIKKIHLTIQQIFAHVIVSEPVMLKVFTSVIRNKIFKFVRDNNYIETNNQKGFWPGLSGAVEHTELLNYLLNDSRNKQRSSIVVTLIDLKNAFGEYGYECISGYECIT